MAENNQQKWRGIRPVNPPENIPVDIKAHTVNTPIIPATPPQNIPVEIKSSVGWEAQGSDSASLNNPGDGTIVLDTGALAVGYYDVFVTISVDTTHRWFAFQVRNAANNATLHTIYIHVAASTPAPFTIKNIKLVANERFRVLQGNAITGKLEAGLWWTRHS